MILKKLALLFLCTIILSSCKTAKIQIKEVEKIVKEEEVVQEIKEEPANKIGDLWLDDNTYMVSATGYPRTDSLTDIRNSEENKESLRQSALSAAYELAYIKVEYAFLREMRVKDNTTIETVRKIIDKYIIETKVDYVNERYINLTVIVKASFLRQHLKNNTLDRLL